MIYQLKAYEAITMTITASSEFEAKKKKKKKKYETFKERFNKIQEELHATYAPQEDYDEEAEICRDVKEEVNAARKILKTKQMEWNH
jgi:uncharacterized protein involved in exopolysaccharide biosynthesis